MAASLARWLSRRFVLLAEIAGYAISAAVGAFVLYAAFTQTEITASVEGTLRPSTTPVIAVPDAMLVAYLAADGADIVSGTPVCRVVTDPAEQRREQVRGKLAEACSLLSQGTDDASVALYKRAEALLSEIPPSPVASLVPAPTGGVLRLAPAARGGGSGKPAEPLATIYSPDSLAFEGSLPVNTSVAQSQPAIIVLPDGGPALKGTVLAVDTKAKPAKVTVVVTEVPAALAQEYRAALAKPLPDTWPAAKARIVTGYHSLFKQLFGKR